MSKIEQIILPFDQALDAEVRKMFPGWKNYRVISKSLDARGVHRGKKPKFHYKLEYLEQADQKYQVSHDTFPQLSKFKRPPLIIGAGPAGLFAALRFAEYGIPCVLFERGAPAKERMIKISRYWRYGELDPNTNVCFGEGGAGLFSDGKLITRIKSPLVSYVMKKFVQFGAPAETAYLSNPHLGSNKIREIISLMTAYLKQQGQTIHYHTKIDEVLFDKNKVKGVKTSDGKIFESDHIILAMGHSADEMYQQLHHQNVAMKSKDFAIGVRLEHKRNAMDQMQLGEFAGHPALGTARYRLSFHDRQSSRGTYSFCMCPGGYVLSTGTEANGLITNGMSNYRQNSPWSNAAIVMSVKSEKDFDKNSVLSGLKFQRNIEQTAFKFSKKNASGKELPCLTFKEYLDQKINTEKIAPHSCPSGLVKVPLDEILPSDYREHFLKAMNEFDRSLPGFAADEAMMIAPETRTSAPVTIIRDKETMESLSHRGLFPCGEGAGHAGGITSAAVDGIKAVEAILSTFK